MDDPSSRRQCVNYDSCGNMIDEDRDYRKVTGWEKRRAQGGTNALRGRETHDVWACRFCVDKQARGIAPEQTALI
jgi:hypothetical protein